MKTQITTMVVRKFKLTYLYMSAIIILLSSFSPVAVIASDSTTIPANLAQITLVGILDKDQVLFQVEFDNTKREVFELTITDQDGYIFFNGKFQDSSFSKKFLFNKLENGNVNLVFTLKSRGTNQSQSFHVDTQLVERTVVTKL